MCVEGVQSNQILARSVSRTKWLCMWMVFLSSPACTGYNSPRMINFAGMLEWLVGRPMQIKIVTRTSILLVVASIVYGKA